MLLYLGRTGRNRARTMAIRDEARDAVEALAQLFVDAAIVDAAHASSDAVPVRLKSLLAATEHRFVPGLHTGADIGMSGFRPEFEDPWESSTDQAGHFLTAARLAYDPSFLNNPVFRFALGAFGDGEVALKLLIGHEKVTDPPSATWPTPRIIIAVLRQFRRQYRSVTAADIAHFHAGDLELIQVGSGKGNSLADLRLSHKGWLFGRQVSTGHFKDNHEVASWIRKELGAKPSH